MTHESLLNAGWLSTVDRLGGAEQLETEAREIGAFRRAREVKCAVDLLRLTLAYCLGSMGLRLTAAWAEASGLAILSNVALLQRLRNMVAWLEVPPFFFQRRTSRRSCDRSADPDRRC